MDTETTGMDEDDQVVELAILTCEVEVYSVGGRRREVLRPVTMLNTLISPTVAVKPEARAVHHLTDAELMLAPTLRRLLDARGGYFPELHGDVIVAAHNLEFDERMMAQSLEQAAGAFIGDAYLPQRRLCTYRAARHVYPQAARHSNQYLRYWLGIDLRLTLPPHRAAADVMVTHAVLQKMLEHATLDEMLDMRMKPALLASCPVGKFRGKSWEEVDSGMLRWILGRDFEPDVLHTARHHLRLRGGVR